MRLLKLLSVLAPFLLAVGLANQQIDNATRDFITGFLNAVLNLTDWINEFRGSIHNDLQRGAYTIGRSLIVLGLIWSLIRAVYYASLEEILAAMARVVVAGMFLWFGEAVESRIATGSLHQAVASAFRSNLEVEIKEAANNLKALGAVMSPIFALASLIQAGVLHIMGGALDRGIGDNFTQELIASTGATLQFLNPASFALIPFIVAAVVFTVLVVVMFTLASALFPIVAGSLALPIGLGAELFGRWVSVVVWSFIIGAVGPVVVAKGLELGVNRPAEYIVTEFTNVYQTWITTLDQRSEENRDRFARRLQQIGNPQVCGFNVITKPNGKYDVEFGLPQRGAFLSPLDCASMYVEAAKYTFAEAANLVTTTIRGILNAFQAWVQSLVLTISGMAAAMLITGYLASLIANFFGGLSVSAMGVATRTAGQAAVAVAQLGALLKAGQELVRRGLGRSSSSGGGSWDGGGGFGGGGGGIGPRGPRPRPGPPPAYERPAYAYVVRSNELPGGSGGFGGAPPALPPSRGGSTPPSLPPSSGSTPPALPSPSGGPGGYARRADS